MKYYSPTRLSENIGETPEGYLICIGVPIARTGEMVYVSGETPLEVGDDGKVLVYRSEKEVFNEKTIASFEGKSVTIRHPEKFVDPSNWRELTIGVIQNVRRGKGEQDQELLADVLVMDAEGIKKVKEGLREVSCGYEADFVQDEKGRGEQINIIGNHLALVEQGRAGSSFAIRDHKGVSDMKKSLKEKVMELFSNAQAEAVKVIDAAAEEKKDDKKKEGEGKDAEAEVIVDNKAVMQAIDELKGMLAGKKDDKKKDGSDTVVGDEEEGASPSLEERLNKLEAAVAKLLEREAKEDEVKVDDEDAEEIVEDEDMEGESSLVGDEAAQVEILAPGLKATKNIKVEALKKAYSTKDGKAAIEKLIGKRAPAYDSASEVEVLFNGAAEILKSTRTEEFAGSKQVRDSKTEGNKVYSPEDINAMNKEYYSKK